MSCNNCKSTVWFDHKAKVWKHGRSIATRCKSPEPYNISSHPLPAASAR